MTLGAELSVARALNENHRDNAQSELSGVTVEVADLENTRAFYEPLFEHTGGRWVETPRGLTYEVGSQRFQFARRPRPRTLGDSGQHQAYSVPTARIDSLERRLGEIGRASGRWREDHPEERSVSPYLTDPSGNRVQLVASEEGAPLLHHLAVEVHDLELAEPFYVRLLGGTPDYYHGWRMDDYAEAKRWEDGEDPCAPWTRRFDVRYWDKLRVARPNMQLFVRFGGAYLGLILATEHRQEPPPEIRRGTPSIVFQSRETVGARAESLSRARQAFEQEGTSLYLRDPAGNYVQVVCAA